MKPILVTLKTAICVAMIPLSFYSLSAAALSTGGSCTRGQAPVTTGGQTCTCSLVSTPGKAAVPEWSCVVNSSGGASTPTSPTPTNTTPPTGGGAGVYR
jgi:hypothetical protein